MRTVDTTVAAALAKTVRRSTTAMGRVATRCCWTTVGAKAEMPGRDAARRRRNFIMRGQLG
jgi:hypothetical protein